MEPIERQNIFQRCLKPGYMVNIRRKGFLGVGICNLVFIILIVVIVLLSSGNCRPGIEEWLMVVLSFLIIQFLFMMIAEVVLSNI
jgi:hypothetical protein